MIALLTLLLIRKVKGIEMFQFKELAMEMQLLARMIQIKMIATAVHQN